MPNPASPSPASSASMELPEGIASAIQYFEMAAKEWGDAQGDPPTGDILKACRSALTAAIFSRLREAEAGRDAALVHAQGEEVDAALDRSFRQIAEAQRDAALARVERLEKALTWYVENDDVNLNDPGNEFWVDGYNRAKALLSEAPSHGDQ